jgi:hypothetical protein
MVQEMVTNIAPLHTFQIIIKLSKYMQPILKYSKNNMWFFWMAPKAAEWLTWIMWSTSGPISNPPAFGVIYVIKYSGGFRYFISHDIKIGLKHSNITMGPQQAWKNLLMLCHSFQISKLFECALHKSIVMLDWMYGCNGAVYCKHVVICEYPYFKKHGWLVHAMQSNGPLYQVGHLVSANPLCLVQIPQEMC